MPVPDASFNRQVASSPSATDVDVRLQNCAHRRVNQVLGTACLPGIASAGVHQVKRYQGCEIGVIPVTACLHKQFVDMVCIVNEEDLLAPVVFPSESDQMRREVICNSCGGPGTLRDIRMLPRTARNNRKLVHFVIATDEKNLLRATCFPIK